MKLRNISAAVAILLILASCVSTKKFKAEVARYDRLNSAYIDLQGNLKTCLGEKEDVNRSRALLQSDIDNLNKQVAYLKENNTQALRQLQDLSVITAAQAASINKSLENIGAKDSYIQSLQASMARKDSLNMVLVMNLKGAVGNLNDQDINIKVDKGVVYIDISDKLLFKSGSYEVTDNAKTVLGKVAQVLKNQPDIEFMVEGHTDNVPFKKGVLLDNWDLSVKRATTVVRLLQNQYGLDPTHIAAAGRGEYKPLMANDSAESRAANRRTRIVILPLLDQFFKLLEKKES